MNHIELEESLARIAQHEEVYSALTVGLLLLAAAIGYLLVKRILVRYLHQFFKGLPSNQAAAVTQTGFIKRLSLIVPAMIVMGGIGLIPLLPPAVAIVVRNVGSAYIILVLGLALNALLDIVNLVYRQRADAHLRPIKGYVQVLKIAVYVISALLMIATLIDRSPLILLSGLGAMAAVLMLIFQDTLLSLVASVQISSNDIIRVGDWIEMPQLNADGDVIDIALHTVKVQNWDMTISVIPTKRFVTDSFKNWRGMQESGGRRIKRSLYLDQNSVHFLDTQEVQDLGRFELLKPYLNRITEELQTSNLQLSDPLNARRLTNLGTFRVYVQEYLRANPDVRKDMSLMVRQLHPEPSGLPLELYCFTNTNAWAAYEGIQADIFDHLLAILPAFGLRVFQNPSGADLRGFRERPAQS